MKFSAFSRFGHFSFTPKPSLPEQFYRAYVANVQGAFDMSQGTHAEATAFARAHAAARAGRTLERAGNQIDPLKATEILPKLETDYDVIPGPYQDTPSRRRTVSTLQKLPAGGTYPNIRAALVTLLGSEFLAYRLLTQAEVNVWPPAPVSSISSNFQRIDIPSRLLATIDPITTSGVPIWVSYANADPTTGTVSLYAGDVVMFSPENSAGAEKVTIVAVRVVAGVRQLQATFLIAHDIGSHILAGTWPYQWSTQRFAFIIVKATSAVSAEKRRLINEFMPKMARGVSQWAIVQPTTVGALTIGPFTIPAALGCTPIGTFAFSLLP